VEVLLLELRLLGQFDLKIDGVRQEIASRPAQSLLAYLALNQGVPQRRERLAGLLWPDTLETSARSNLRQALWQLRRALAPCQCPVLHADDIHLIFDPGEDSWLDTALIEAKSNEVCSTEELLTAVEAYRGELLPGFYEDWVLLERERLHTLFEQKITQLLDLLIQDSDWQATLEWAGRWISLGRIPEPAYRAEMQAHYALGDLPGAIAAYQRCVDAMQHELGIRPSDQTRQLYESLTETARII
jgi:DNA-binding SARP family transcriptional activator